MSDRERWIVYPLLFFSLAIGFRNVGRTGGAAEFSRIECQQLLVKSPTGSTRIQMSGNEATGRLAVLGKNQVRTVVIDSTYDGTSGKIEVRNVTRPSWVVLKADPDGGRCEIKSSPTEPAVLLGMDRETKLTGLFAYEYNRHPCQLEVQSNGVAFITEADQTAKSESTGSEKSKSGADESENQTDGVDEQDDGRETRTSAEVEEEVVDPSLGGDG